MTKLKITIEIKKTDDNAWEDEFSEFSNQKDGVISTLMALFSFYNNITDIPEFNKTFYDTNGNRTGYFNVEVHHEN